MAITKAQNKSIIIAAIIAILVIGGAAYWYYTKPTSDFHPKAPEVNGKNPTEPGKHDKNTGAASSNPPQPIPRTNQPSASSSGAITITKPTGGATVTSGTIIEGTTSVSSGLNYRLKGSKSGQLAAGPVTPSGSNYHFELQFTNQVAGGEDTGVLEVYSLSSTDGSEINQASIAVNIRG